MKRVVGLFDDRTHATQVQQELQQSGIAADRIRVVDQGKQYQEKGFWESLGDLFGGDDQSIYQEATRRGGTLVMVETDEQHANQVATVMNRHNAIDVEKRTEEWRKSGWQGHGAQAATGTAAASHSNARATTQTQETAGKQVIPVTEEQLHVGKRREQAGGVRIHSHVTETPVQEQVTLRDEKVHVERHRVDRPADAAAFQDRTIEARETREQAVVSKEARVVEEIVLSKEVQQHTETVRDTVRRTDVRIEDLDADFRQDFDRSFASSGYTYEQLRPAYDYGRQLAMDERYHGRDWSAVESDAQRMFEAKNPGKWNTFRPAVRRGYDEARSRSKA